MDKHNVIESGILFHHKKGWNTNSCCNMDEPWKDHAKLRKPDPSDHMSYCTYMKCSEWTNRYGKLISSNGWVEGRMESNYLKSTGFSSGVMEMF